MKQLKGKQCCMAMKLDMCNGYVRIEWDFLDDVLMRFNFDTCWKDRLMDCVRSVTFLCSLVVGLQILLYREED